MPLGKLVLVIGGPTASGKNAIAHAIARQVPSEFLNADSRQIYRHLSIGTNQPTSEEQSLIPHHLYGFLEPDESFTAADYERLAMGVIREVVARNRLPVVIGGTGFYLKALLKGTWPAPAKDDRLRRRFRRIETRRGRAFLHRMLKRLDPEAALRVSVNDIYRVIRALEIFFQSGRRPSSFRVESKDRFDAIKVYIDRDRTSLREAIERRTDSMFEHGWVEEVRGLVRKYPDFDTLPASASLGYREITRMLRGEWSEAQCKQTIVRKTRQYAKRQVTWFRNQDGFVPIHSAEEVYKKIQTVLE